MHRRAGVAQRVVDGLGRRAHARPSGTRRRRRPSGPCAPGDPWRWRRPTFVGAGRRSALRGAEARGRAADRTRPRSELPRDALDLRGAKWKPMIGLGAGQRWRALDGVEPAHRGVLFGEPASPREILRIPHAARSARQEVGVERDDHVGLVEVVDRARLRAPRARVPRGTRDGVELVPASRPDSRAGCRPASRPATARSSAASGGEDPAPPRGFWRQAPVCIAATNSDQPADLAADT